MARTEERLIMDVRDEVGGFLQVIADFADGFQKRVGWLVGIGLVFSLLLAYDFYSAESAWWWNAMKCGTVLLPALVWLLVWQLLGQLQEAPKMAAELVNQDQGLVDNLRLTYINEGVGVRSAFQALNQIRSHGGLDVMLETMGSVTLLINPVFALFALLMVVALLGIIMLGPVFWII